MERDGNLVCVSRFLFSLSLYCLSGAIRWCSLWACIYQTWKKDAIKYKSGKQAMGISQAFFILYCYRGYS